MITLYFVVVQSMAWLGSRLLIATAQRYMLLDPASGDYKEILTLPENQPALLQPLPSSELAVVVMVGPCGAEPGLRLTTVCGVKYYKRGRFVCLEGREKF